MSVEISDMIEFVNRISALNFPDNEERTTVAMTQLRADEVKVSDAELKDTVKVDKVEGV